MAEQLQQPELQVLDRVDRALEGLPANQLIWLSGYLYGLARQPRGQGTLPTAVPAAVNLAVLFGSQTGNARRLAEQAVAKLKAAGHSSELKSLGKLKARDLAKLDQALFVVSTQGDGEPAEDALAFYEGLLADSAPRLPQLRYAVLGLGDSSYPKFNAAARILDDRLAALGAQQLHVRLEADLDYTRTAPVWLQSFGESLPKAQPAPATTVAGVSSPGGQATADQPALAEVLSNQRLTARESRKDTRHLELAIDPQRLDYQPGDALGLHFTNPPELVEPLLLALGAAESTEVSAFGETLQLGQWLRQKLEISKLGRPLLTALARSGRAPQAQALLDAPAASLQAQLRALQVIDLVRAAPDALSLAELVAALPPLAPRLYSIASSRKAVGDEVHLTIALRAEPRADRVAYGACSTAIAALKPGDSLPVYVESNERFRLPADGARDLIMIGPGTGVAPFRAFLQERVAEGAQGRNWLLFGSQHLRQDFLYQLEWQEALRLGQLHKLSLAFSRDGARKTYVQDRLLQAGADLYAWLEGGAHLYVCGDALGMAPAVEQALIAAVAEHGGRSPQQAHEYVAGLKREGRYAQDVY